MLALVWFPSLASAAEGSLARQLFYPLLMSAVHWLTKNARREAAETMALLDALLLGVADANSAAKRFAMTPPHCPPRPNAQLGGTFTSLTWHAHPHLCFVPGRCALTRWPSF